MTQREITLSPGATVADIVAPGSRAARLAVGLALSVLFAGLTVVGAHIVIPLQPVPITLQTLFVILAGASIGRGWGAFSQALYVGLGAAGLPVFAGGAAGAGVLLGPTGGYLAAFLVAPFLVGGMLRISDRLAWQCASFAAGAALILALGVAHLAIFVTHDVGRALAVGLVPFLPGAVLKVAAAVSIHRSSRALIAYHGRRR
jgi:biotin transport system substrate-specific component